MESEHDEPGVRYGSYVIVHSPGTKRPRLNDGYAIKKERPNGGMITAHNGDASKAVFHSEAAALIAAHSRAKAWIDENLPKLD